MAEPAQSAREAKGQLLVVDDNEMNRDMLSRRLARRGYAVETAAGGQEALDMVEQQIFDVILLDIMMPGIDGIEVLERLRKTYSAGELPIIMATAKDESDDIVDALKRGANDYVTKPLDFPVVLARVQTQLSLKRAKDELATAHARMKRDLDAAARVQQSLLPQTDFESDSAFFTWRYTPCDELAGDALNVFQIDDDHIGIYIVDVSGHGVPASLLSVAVMRSLTPRHDPSSLIAEDDPNGGVLIRDPAEVATRLNTIFPMEANGMHYFTLLYGILDTRAGTFRYVCGGHPGPVVVRPDEAKIVDAPALPVGVTDETDYEDTTIQLAVGDRIYLHSDGINEQANPEGKMFGRTRMLQALEADRAMTLDQTVDSLFVQLADWAGDRNFEDDLSVLAFQYRG